MIWYVDYTEPWGEIIAKENLLRQGYLLQLSLDRKVIRRKVSFGPFFPRYLFFAPSSDRRPPSPVRSAMRVAFVAQFGMDLGALSDPQDRVFMAYVKAQQGGGGLTSLLKMQEIRPGQKVLVNSGAFAGLEGFVSEVANDRVMVLMGLLGKEQILGFQLTAISTA